MDLYAQVSLSTTGGKLCPLGTSAFQAELGSCTLCRVEHAKTTQNTLPYKSTDVQLNITSSQHAQSLSETMSATKSDSVRHT